MTELTKVAETKIVRRYDYLKDAVAMIREVREQLGAAQEGTPGTRLAAAIKTADDALWEAEIALDRFVEDYDDLSQFRLV